MKAHFTLSLDEDVWLMFKVECTRRKLTFSKEVERLLQKRLAEFAKEELAKKNESH